MNETENQMKRLAYELACQRFTESCERANAEAGEILLAVPQPNQWFSKVVGSSWRLRNVNGSLANVGWNGRVV